MSDAAVRTLDVAKQAFEHFRRGLGSGDWQPWLDVLTDDFSFRFPMGRWRGEHRGKGDAAEFFAYVRQVYPEGLELEVDRVTANESTVVFEFRDWGALVIPGQPPREYRNRVAVSLDVRGDRIAAYREYFGSDGVPD
jgi:ketosteroid isomerase-like protein